MNTNDQHLSSSTTRFHCIWLSTPISIPYTPIEKQKHGCQAHIIHQTSIQDTRCSSVKIDGVNCHLLLCIALRCTFKFVFSVSLIAKQSATKNRLHISGAATQKRFVYLQANTRRSFLNQKKRFSRSFRQMQIVSSIFANGESAALILGAWKNYTTG